VSERSPQSIVEQAEAWGAEDWWRLELRSFSKTPAQRALAVIAPREVMSDHRGITPGSFLQGLAYLISIAAPVTAAATMLRWAVGGSSYDFPVVFAGAVTLIGLVITAWSEVQRYRHPRAVRPGALRMVAGIHIIPGVISLGIAFVLGNDLVSAEHWPWLLAIVLDIVVHVVSLLRGPVRADGPQNDRENLVWSLREIPPSTLEAIVDQRNSAIRRLAERGLIEGDTARRAEASAAGALALTMAPELERTERDEQRG
jgi:hypothetical protein